MSERRWIVIPKFNGLQHTDAMRSESGMPWIKLLTRTLADDAVMDLTTHRRWIYLGLLMHYSRSRGLVTVSTSRLSHYLSCRVTEKDLESLNEAGLIEFSASKPAGIPAGKHASPEKRREEKKNPLPPSGQNRNNGRPRKLAAEEVPALIDVVTACQIFIQGWAWDDSYDEQAIRDELGRIERGRRTQGTLDEGTITGLLEQWAAQRQDRYGIKANLG